MPRVTHAIAARFRSVPASRLVWALLGAAWFAGLATWRLPFLHWHHFPVTAAILHGLTYFPAFLLVAAMFIYFESARGPAAPASKNIGYIPRLDHLRFFAASLVVMYHYYHTVVPGGAPVQNPIYCLFSEGSSGVDLFFVLSGLIFGLISHGRKVRYFDFLVSRIVRIYPLYLFAIAVVVATHFGMFNALDSALLMFPIFEVASFPGGLPGFGQLWTIGLEFQFYLIFPFLAAFVLRSGPRYLWGLLALAIGLRWVYFTQGGPVRDLSYWSLLGRIDEFIAGLLASQLFARRPRLFSHPGHLVLSIAAMLGGIYWLTVWGGFFNGADSPWWIVWSTVEGAFWAYLALSYLSCRIGVWSWLDESLARLGQLSFSIYVMHTYAVLWTQKYLAPIHLTSSREADAALGGLLVCLPLAVLSAVPTYHLIEKQFFIYRRKYTEERGSGVQAPTAAVVAGTH